MMKNLVKTNYLKSKVEEMSIDSFLDGARTNSEYYASPAERILKAIGEPELVDTKNDPILSRVFSNRVIKKYKVFEEFYGMEDVVEKLVNYFKHSSQGLEESKQILYFLGPVGGGKSTLAEKIKKLIEIEPIYVLAYKKEGKLDLSPIQESPLGLFPKESAEELGIPPTRFKERLSPWAIKKLNADDGKLDNFRVVKMYPSQSLQRAVAKVEPGDENNQDISTLVGKINVRQTVFYDQNDTDAYGYTGGLCHGNQGVLEFVEMFKAPLKVLHPLLTATQEGNYNPTESIGAIPFDGVVVAHSNEAEWQQFRNEKTNEAFIDRVYIIKVPYCLRASEEKKIYEKLIKNSTLSQAPCAPYTLKILSEFAVLSRLFEKPEGTKLYSKMRVYDGESLKDREMNVKTAQEYRDHAGVTEGFDGISTRFCFKVLSATFNFDPEEIAANPIHLIHVLKDRLYQEQLPDDLTRKYTDKFIDDEIVPRFYEFLEKEVQTSYMESYSEYGQNLFDKYIDLADFWLQDQDYRDAATGELLDRSDLDKQLSEIEHAAGVGNTKDFRNEVVTFVLRSRSKNGGKNPKWTSYEKLREVIEKKMFSKTEDLIPLISFSAKSSKDDQRKHDDFVERMVKHGYTKKQVRLCVDWYLRYKKSK